MEKEFDPEVFKGKTVFYSHDYNSLPAYGKNVIAILTAGNEKAIPPKYKDRVGLVFKHHLNRNSIGNVYHIPLTYVQGFDGDAAIPILDRKYDVVFIGRTCKRKDMWENVQKWQAKHPEKNCFLFDSGQKFMGQRGGMNIKQYSKYMKDAKIVLSPKGMVRCECLRFSEAVKCGSAIVACPHPMDVRVFKNCPASYVNNWNELESVLDSYTDEKLVKIHEKMKVCWKDYFSPKAVGQYINKVVRSILC
jgi:hypothetical protein